MSDNESAANMLDDDDPNPPRCASCGVALREHLGLYGTCAEVLRLRAEVDRLQNLCDDHLDKTADGKFVVECDNLYCPNCGGEVRQTPWNCLCDKCVNPDDGAYPNEPPLPLFFSSCLSVQKSKEQER